MWRKLNTEPCMDVIPISFPMLSVASLPLEKFWSIAGPSIQLLSKDNFFFSLHCKPIHVFLDWYEMKSLIKMRIKYFILDVYLLFIYLRDRWYICKLVLWVYIRRASLGFSIWMLIKIMKCAFLWSDANCIDTLYTFYVCSNYIIWLDDLNSNYMVVCSMDGHSDSTLVKNMFYIPWGFL